MLLLVRGAMISFGEALLHCGVLFLRFVQVCLCLLLGWVCFTGMLHCGVVALFSLMWVSTLSAVHTALYTPCSNI